MTYCVAIAVAEGLVFVTDSRTNAGVDQVASHSKMHVFGLTGERQFVLLSAGNLATTQAVVSVLRHDIESGASVNLMNVARMADAADYIGAVVHAQIERYAAAVTAAGFSAETTIVMGGQIAGRPTRLYMIYPQGNYIEVSQTTPYLQIGESKYGKPILDRVVFADSSIDNAALAALVSMDSTMRSNATVGPPVEMLAYRADTFTLDTYLRLDENDPYLLAVRQGWNEHINAAFRALPAITWGSAKDKPTHA